MLLGACVLFIILSWFRRDFLYILIVLLSMINVMLHRPVQIGDLQRKAVFTGDVISEDERGDYTKLSIKLVSVQINGQTIKYRLPVEFYTRTHDTKLGRRIQIKGALKSPASIYKPHTITGYIENDGAASFFLSKMIYPLRHYISEVFSRVFDEQQCALAKSLVLGGSGRIQKDVRDIFSRAGVLHILAVSGLHVGFVCVFIGLLLIFIPVSARLKFIIIMLVLILYAGITGFRPSVCRALAMAFLFGVSVLVQRNVDRIHITNMALLGFLIFDPSLFFNISVHLSFAAVYGIFFLYPFFENQLIHRLKSRMLRMAVIPMIISLCAQLFVAPFVVYYFHRLPTLAVFTNFLVVPLASICVCLLFAILIVNIFSIFCAQCLGFLVAQLFRLLLFITGLITQLPFSTVTLRISPVFIPLYFLFFCRNTRRTAAYAFVILLSLHTLVGFSDCLVIISAPAGILVSNANEHIFVTDKCSTIDTARLLDQFQIGELDLLIAPSAYFPEHREFTAISDRSHIQYITAGGIFMKIGRSLEVFYRGRPVRSYTCLCRHDDIKCTVTNGIEVYGVSVPDNCSIMDQIILDARLMILKAIMFF
jgi:ComEC/Rec2-related protein